MQNRAADRPIIDVPAAPDDAGSIADERENGPEDEFEASDDARYIQALHFGASPATKSAVQMSPAPGAAPAGPTPGATVTPASVTLKLKLQGKLGGDLSATVKVEAQDQNKKRWKTVESQSATISDSAGATGTKSHTADKDVTIAKHGRYKITVTPTAASPDDRYTTTTRSVLDAASKTVTIKLAVNRWNKKNVATVWTDEGIDPAKAAKTKTVTLLTRRVTVNELVVPRVDATNAEFAKLSEDERKEVIDSIVIMGGYAYRTTSKGGYSNHSTGCAIDINYNGDTQQNHHFHHQSDKGDRAILEFAQRVIRNDPAFVTYDIFTAKGEKVLAASKAFERQFPLHVAKLLDLRAADMKDWYERNPDEFNATLQDDNDDLVMKYVGREGVEKAIATTKDAAAKKELQFISTHWSVFDAWVRGTMVRDNVDKKDERLKGMVPLHEKLLEVFTTAGWSWGGNWTSAKDYMHFEDLDAMDGIKR